ncbi:LamG-like jellyroll fold domain-containing protein [Rhizocola hellebori]|uniref:LamG-like jellyroll fold domain-containing protein n=1 Tax=Rhizocola hellebori TaxID=1392758 RepID=UPI00194165CE|nr:LamG-like jellyroll fold domain-containing protein [Rhizocola hellebori]
MTTSLLITAAPLGRKPDRPAEFPLAGLWAAITARPAWSVDRPATPKQERGGPTDVAGVVSPDKTRANGGNGRGPGRGIGELGDYVPPRAPSAKPSTTGAIASGFDEGTSRRVGGTKTSDLFRNADGSLTHSVSSQPVNFKAADGSWQPIDATLVRQGDRLRPNASGVQVSFAGSRPKGFAGAPLAAEAGGSGRSELAVITLPGGQELAYSLQGAAPADPTVAGPTATYAAVMPGMDIELSAFGGGQKETLILHERPAVNSWVFPLRLKGLRAMLDADGSISLLDDAARTVAKIPHGYMQDSKFREDEGDFVKSDAVSYELVDGALKVTADRKWLDDPARVYPVRIDPTTTVSTDGDVTIDPDPDTHAADQNGTSIAVGWDSSLVGNPLRNDIKVSYLAFGDFKSATGEHPNLTGMRISAATLNLFHTWTPSSKCNSHLPFSVHSVNSSWTVAGLSDASTGPSVSPAIGTLTVANNYPACTNTSADRSVGNWVAVNLTDLRIFNAWSQGVLPNYGLALTASGSDHGAFKRFTSENFAGTCKGRNCQPYLRVTYAPDSKPQLNDAFPANGYASPTLTPELLADATDAEGDPLTYRFRVYDSTGAQIADSTSTSARSWTVPPNLLKWSESYTWTVVASDGVVATDTKVNVLMTTPPQPLITSRLSQNPGSGIEPSIGNYTTTVVDADIPTVGPALRVERHYNSRDPRSGVFGSGWSSLLDSKITFGTGLTGSMDWLTVTYPDGQDVVFGRRADGSYAPPPGRFATLRQLYDPGTFVFELVEKNGLKFTFTNRPSPFYDFTEPRLVSIEDPHGRALLLKYTKGIHWVDPILMTTLQVMYYQRDSNGNALASWPGRKLSFTYSGTNVETISTEPATAGDTSTVSTWSYTYDSGKLVKVCSPHSATACTRYEYGANWLYPTAVQDADPHTYLRLDDPVGSPAAISEPTDGSESATGVYQNVALEQQGPPGSQAKAATFDGTSSLVSISDKAALRSGYQTMSMWFKGSSGVLFSASASPLPGAASGTYVPVLYIGTDGKLRGQVWNGAMAPITSTATVNDGQWHHVVLSAAGATQTLYLDGVQVGDPLTGAIQSFGQKNFYLGAGYWANWPSASTSSIGYFNGSISDFAFYTKQLTADQVKALRGAGLAPSTPLTKVIRPMGGVDAEITYDSSGVVSQLIDENRGTWKVSPAEITGSDNIYASAVLGGAPADYWRLGETGTPQIARNELNGADASFNLVTLGEEGPFTTRTAARFNGTSSYLKLPSTDVPQVGPESISLWFKVDAGGSGVLFSYQSGLLTDVAGTAGWDPALYVGTDGKLRGQLWAGGGTSVTTTGKVDDGNWHHAVLASSSASQSLYLDGVKVGTVVKNRVDFGATHAYIGAGKWLNWASTTGSVGYWPGSIAEVAYYRSELTAGDVSAQFAAYQKSTGAPTRTVVLTDPVNKDWTYRYDSVNGRRIVESVDPLGGKTVYGYDSGGFLRSTTDPIGNMEVTGHDVRGNVVSKTSCQDRSANKCSTSYYTFYPDATTKTLTPDARNDLPLTIRDGRSLKADDPTYLTTMGYDAKGNRTEVIDALGSKVLSEFTDGSGGVPAGLLKKATLPNGAQVLTTFNAFGDIAYTTDAAGLRTDFTYDGLGGAVAKTTLGLVTSYRFDKLGRIVEQTDPPFDNDVTSNTHTRKTTTTLDNDGRVVETREVDTTGDDSVTPRVTTMDYGTQRMLKSVTDPGGHVQQFEYDDSGRITKQIAADGVATVYSYDAAGRHIKSELAGSPDSATAANTDIESRQYDLAGRLAVITDAQGYRHEYTYTDNGLVASIVRRDPAPGPESVFVLESNVYDGAGNLISKVTNNGASTTDYTVDQLSRVTEALLDPAGLKRKQSMTYGSHGGVVSTTLSDSAGTQTADYSYDLAGRMLSQSIRMPAATGGPSGAWQLNETTGTTAADSSPAARTGTLNGSVTWSDGGAAFTGTSNVSVPGPVLTTTASYTVSAWVKLTDNAVYRSAVSIDGTKTSAFYLGYSKAVNKWRISGCNTDVSPTSCVNAVSNAAIQLNVWTQLTGVYNQSAHTLKLYVNGVPQQSVAYTAWAATGSLAIGRGKTGGVNSDQWQGGVDNVQAYQRVLTDAEIALLYTGGRSGGALSSQAITSTVLRDTLGRVTQQTDPNGNVTKYFYDSADRLVRTEQPSVSAEEHGVAAVPSFPVQRSGYNTFGELVDTKDAKGRVVSLTRDTSGWVIATKLPTNDGMTPRYTTSYDAVGRVKTQTDPFLKATSYDYDRMGRLKTVTTPDTGVSRFAYDLLGNLTSSTDPTGAVTEATYDPLGRQTTLTQIVRQPTAVPPTPVLRTTNVFYSNFATPDRVVSPKGVTSETTYNAAGETVWAKSPAGNYTDYRYDYAGRPTWVFPALGAVEKLEYDSAGRRMTHRLYTPGPGRAGTPGAQIDSESVAYDNNGNVTSATDFRGNTTSFTYDARGLLATQTEPESITTSFGYDLSGAPTRFTDGRGNRFWTTYNGWGMEKSRIEPQTADYPESTFTTAYDLAGRVARQTRPGNVTLTYSTDTMGRVTKIVGDGAEAATANRTFGYDLAGRVTSLPGMALSYDDTGLLLKVTGASGNSEFEYNEDGQMAVRKDDAGTTSYDYTFGRLAHMSNTGTGVDASVAYNALEQAEAITYGGSSANVRRFGYDDRHRLRTDELKTSLGASIGKITYGWDDNGNETSKTTVGFGASGSAANVYTYDNANRLTSWTSGPATASYGYDKSGNRTSANGKTFTYNERNQLKTSSDGLTYSYTERGSRLSTTSTATGTVTPTAVSDAFDQVVRQYYSATEFSEFTYDGLGRAIKPGFAYSGLENDLAKDGANLYTRDPGGGLVGVKQVGGSSALAWTDLHSDVVGQFTSTGSALTGSAVYDPLGKVLESTPGMLGNLGYQSEWTDPQTDRVNMHSRWYNPDTGQFDSRDSWNISATPSSGDANRYSYTNQNPLTNQDPTGHMRDAHDAFGNPGYCSQTPETAKSCSDGFNKGKTGDPAKDCGKNKARCFVKGVMSEFNIISMIGDIISLVDSISDLDKAWADIKEGWEELKKQAASWGDKLRDEAGMPSILATVLGWVCVVSGACEGINACINNGPSECAYHVGAGVAKVATTYLSGGVKNFLDRVRSMAKDLFDRKHRDKDKSTNDDKKDGDKADSGGGPSAPSTPHKATDRNRPPEERDWDDPAPDKGPPGPGKKDKDNDAGDGDADEFGPEVCDRLPRHSFDPATQVLMADGSVKAIGDIRIGDKVVATDPVTGETSAQPVTALHANLDDDLTNVTVGEGEGDRSTRGPTAVTLETTDHHPFWDATTRTWTDAAQLTPGKSTVIGPDGRTLVVKAVAAIDGAKLMRDLTVATVHTYYVLAGQTPILVHNICDNEPDKAVLHWYPDDGHAYIETIVNGLSYVTHSRIIKDSRKFFTEVVEMPHELNPGAHPVPFILRDGPAARRYQERSLGPTVVEFDLDLNSCLTHCARVAQAGGAEEFPIDWNDEQLTEKAKQSIPPNIYRP